MILTCTSCSTRYYADDSSIGAGRTVRCAACGNSWFAEPQLELRDRADDAVVLDQAQRSEPLTRERVERLRRAAEQPGPAPSAAAKFRAQQAERMRRDRMRAAIAAWGATGAAVAASAAGMVVFRQDVAELWPRSASAYAALGLDVNVYGLEFYDLTVERAFDGPTPILLVSGEIRNLGRDDKNLPPVRLSLRDAQSQEVFASVHVVDAHKLHGGQSTPFQIRVENPPADAVDLEATFASPAEGHMAQTASNDPSPAQQQEPLVLNTPVDQNGQPVQPATAATSGPIDGLAPRFAAEGHG
jgi:predicted Zn finger-like uncharacterized protein